MGRVTRCLILPALALVLAGGVAVAATPAPVPATPATAPATPATADAMLPTAAPVVVEGFRSAKFGMTQAEVKAAIVKDFGVKADAITAGVNPAERTQLLSVKVPDLLPGGGTAQVSYVFGYKTKQLIQVGISWSKATDPEMNEAELYANGDVLRTNFLSAGYQPDSVRTGLVMQNGILLFRGQDKDGHATILLLQGEFANGEGGKRTLTPTSLALLYAADPDHPEVFKLAPGQF
jgi:hypothetical protein